MSVLNYRADLKFAARGLRSQMTDAEQKLWFHLRRKQLFGVQFYRQRPIGEYIVDFQAPAVSLIVEVDGSQHIEANAIEYDAKRSAFLTQQGYNVLRFDNLEVLTQTKSVLNVIHNHLSQPQ